jgi:hypothetical protein
MALDAALARLVRDLQSARDPEETIARLDRDLAVMRLGVELYLTGRPFHRDEWILGYGRMASGGWRLVVRPARGDAEPLPLADAPPVVQAAALRLFPSLLEELGQRVRVTVRSIEWARLLPESLPRLADEARRRTTGTSPARRSAKRAPPARRGPRKGGRKDSP